MNPNEVRLTVTLAQEDSGDEAWNPVLSTSGGVTVSELSADSSSRLAQGPVKPQVAPGGRPR